MYDVTVFVSYFKRGGMSTQVGVKHNIYIVCGIFIHCDPIHVYICNFNLPGYSLYFDWLLDFCKYVGTNCLQMLASFWITSQFMMFPICIFQLPPHKNRQKFNFCFSIVSSLNNTTRCSQSQESSVTDLP